MKWMKAVACTALLALSGPAFCDEVPEGIATGLRLWSFTRHVRSFPVVSSDAAACRL